MLSATNPEQTIFPPVEDDFVKKVVEQATRAYFNGDESAARFLQNHNFFEIHYGSVPCLIDRNFDRNANLIPDSSFVASIGPEFDAMKEFFEDTIDNPKCPIDEVVALSNHVGVKEVITMKDLKDKGDFHDYGLVSNSKNFRSGTNDYSINVINRVGMVVKSDQRETYSPVNFVSVDLNIISRLNLTPRTMHVTFIEAKDMEKVSIGDDARKKLFLDLYHKSQKKKILVHCAAGVGRTGNFIFLMEIMKRYQAIFASRDVIAASKAIHEILKRMRSVRPQIVFLESQFQAAIEDAHQLYKYAYENKLFLQEEKAEQKDVTQKDTPAKPAALSPLQKMALLSHNQQPDTLPDPNSSSTQPKL